MALDHLDPRREGTGAAPDVNVLPLGASCGIFNEPTDIGIFGLDGTRLAVGLSESAALAAARAAAGFGHVAEKACDRYQQLGFGHTSCECAWSRDAHTTVQS